MRSSIVLPDLEAGEQAAEDEAGGAADEDH
jgi:hypothetical protein